MICARKRKIITELSTVFWHISLNNTKQKELLGSGGGAPSEKIALFESIGVGNSILMY